MLYELNFINIDLNIKQHNKALKHISRNTLCRRIELLYEDKMQEICINLEKDAIYVCTTTDIWTSRNRRFIGIRAHWVRYNSRSLAIMEDRYFLSTYKQFRDTQVNLTCIFRIYIADRFSDVDTKVCCVSKISWNSFSRTNILTDINASFGLDAEKIVATVTDNGSNFVKAFCEFGANLTNSFLYGK